MTYNEKKSLYESIMKNIAKTIKRQINEAEVTNLNSSSKPTITSFAEDNDDSFNSLESKLDSVSLLFKNNKPKERACLAIENAFQVNKDNFNENEFNSIFTLDLGNKSIDLIESDRINTSVKKVIYKFYNDYDFIKHIVEDTKKVIKYYIDNDKTQSIKSLSKQASYEKFYEKRYLFNNTEIIAQRQITRYVNIIVSRNNQTIKLNEIADVIYLDPFKLCLIMIMNAADNI